MASAQVDNISTIMVRKGAPVCPDIPSIKNQIKLFITKNLLIKKQ